MSNDKRVTEETELTTVADGDLLYIVDVSDTTGSSKGTSKKAQAKNVRGYPVTAAETSAGVTPTNYQYEPGNILRYGSNTSPGVTDMTTAIQSAIDILDGTASGGVVYFPPGEYLVTSALTYQQTGTSAVNPGVSFIGDGRRTSKITYSGTSGFCLNIKGAASMAVSATGRLGLIEGINIKGLGFTGTGETSGNTDGGIYVQGYNHLLIEDCLVTSFGQDGIHLDRIYYNLAPDATLDDRGAFSTLRHSEISNCGRTGLQAGGLNSATDYSVDHLYTENLHIVGSTTTGAKIYAQNWTDNGSLFHGDAIGVHLYAQNTDILTENVTCIGTRFEGGQSDCMLKIDSCLQGRFTNCLFPGHAGPLPTTQVKIATNATYNVGYLTFDQCINQAATTAYDLVGTGAIAYVRIIDNRFNTVTNETANANSKAGIIVKGDSIEHITGGGTNLSLDGVAGNVLVSSLTGDSNDWLVVNNSSKNIQFGSGSGATDVALSRQGAGMLGVAAGDHIIGTVTSGITADTGSAQGGSALTSAINEISVCATTGDSVTLPSAVIGLKITVINNGAQAADVFPATSDNLGAGVNTAVSLAAASNITYVAYDVTNWEAV